MQFFGSISSEEEVEFVPSNQHCEIDAANVHDLCSQDLLDDVWRVESVVHEGEVRFHYHYSLTVEGEYLSVGCTYQITAIFHSQLAYFSLA